jgi:hypothetical protein
MTTSKERDERKLAKVERMVMRADRLDDGNWWGRRSKRVKRLRAQAARIMEIRLANFQRLRAQGRWPRP